MATHPLWRPYELPTDEQVNAQRLKSHVPSPVVVVAPDSTWPAVFVGVRDRIAAALGSTALAIEHLGSTAVPGLPAKPVIDVNLVVPDSADENAYIPALAAAGFELRGREPARQEHRFLRGTHPDVNLHVFARDAQEPQRMRMFRDWLMTHDDDRTAYGALKHQLASQGFNDVMHYNNAKANLIYDIYEKIFAADPRAEHDPHPRLSDA